MKSAILNSSNQVIDTFRHNRTSIREIARQYFEKNPGLKGQPLMIASIRKINGQEQVTGQALPLEAE